MKPIINDKAIQFLIRKDEKFHEIISSYGIPDSWSRPTGFVSLIQIILEQQVSLNSARSTFLKLSEGLEVINPESVLAAGMEQLRSYGISRPKSKYIYGLAQSVFRQELEIDALGTISKKDAYQKLLEIKGIGPWTAQVYLMFALQSPDIYPPGDIALINTILELWPDTDRIHIDTKAEEWSPYRSAACYLLWHYYLKKRGRVHPDDT